MVITFEVNKKLQGLYEAIKLTLMCVTLFLCLLRWRHTQQKDCAPHPSTKYRILSSLIGRFSLWRWQGLMICNVTIIKRQLILYTAVGSSYYTLCIGCCCCCFITRQSAVSCMYLIKRLLALVALVDVNWMFAPNYNEVCV